MNAKPSILWFAVALHVGIVSLASAQIDTAALREVKRRATETFLDSTRPTAERLVAATRLGYPESATFARLLQVGTNAREPDTIRLVALKRARYDDQYFDAVLAIIANPRESESLAAGLIEDVARRTTFRQPAELRQRLQGALRDRLSDPRAAVRLSAYRSLVAMHDQVAISRLVESLRSGANIPIPLPDAIDLLDLDGSTKHIVTLRPYLRHSDPAVQAQAARALAVDPESRPAVVSMTVNRQVPNVVRINALRALSREDTGFVEYAVRLMGDSSEVPDVRYAAMKAAMGRLNYQREPPATQISFAQAVVRLASQPRILTSDRRNVGTAAQQLIPHLCRSFPAVRRSLGTRCVGR